MKSSYSCSAGKDEGEELLAKLNGQKEEGGGWREEALRTDQSELACCPSVVRIV